MGEVGVMQVFGRHVFVFIAEATRLYVCRKYERTFVSVQMTTLLPVCT